MATQEFLLGNIKGATGATGPAGAGAATGVFAGVIPGGTFSSNQAGSTVFMWRKIGELALPGDVTYENPLLLEIAAGVLIDRQLSGMDAPISGNQKHILIWTGGSFSIMPPGVGTQYALAFVPAASASVPAFDIYFRIRDTWGRFMNKGLEPFFIISLPAVLPAGAALTWAPAGEWEGAINTASALFANAQYIGLS